MARFVSFSTIALLFHEIHNFPLQSGLPFMFQKCFVSASPSAHSFSRSIQRKNIQAPSISHFFDLNKSFSPAFTLRGGSSAPSSELATHTDNKPASKSLKLIQVQIVHRHGDRTPITPMKNETFWKQTLPSKQILENIALGTKIIRNGDTDKSSAVHSAGGKGSFGKLTTLGLFQMVDLGSRLREEFVLPEIKEEKETNSGDEANEEGIEIIHQMDSIYKIKQKYLFTPSSPLTPQNIHVVSTDFPRTIQSVQGLLVGMFPDGIPPSSSHSNSNAVDIDARHTNIMIPDPQPRRTSEQVELEKKLAARSYLLEKEEEMRDFAIRLSSILQENVLGEGYNDVSFGVGEEKDGNLDDINAKTITPLPWAQLAEVLKCLAVREMLPPSISLEDQHRVSSHAAWRWFENLRNPRLAFLSMNEMMKILVQNMNKITHEEEDVVELDNLSGEGGLQTNDLAAPVLHIFSAHDSTLIGLLCAFRLEQPSEWPEYGSYFKIELFEVMEDDRQKKSSIQHLVRFSLNSRPLRCLWRSESHSPLELVPLDRLISLVQADGKEPESC